METDISKAIWTCMGYTVLLCFTLFKTSSMVSRSGSPSAFCTPKRGPAKQTIFMPCKPELSDRLLADFLDMDTHLIVTMHVQSVDQVRAIKTVKRKITDIQKMTIEEQKKAVRAGCNMDIIPSRLATYGGEAKKLLQDLQLRKPFPQEAKLNTISWLDNGSLGSNAAIIFHNGAVSGKPQTGIV